MTIIFLLAVCVGLAIVYKLKMKPAVSAILIQQLSENVCSCAKCTPETCKCKENNCVDKCVCHDVVIIDAQADIVIAVEPVIEPVIEPKPVEAKVKPVVKTPVVKKPEVKKTPIAKKPQPKVNTKKKPGKK